MASFIPVHNESDVDSFRPSNPANAKETRVATFGGRPDSPVNFSPENNEKKLTPQHEKQFRQMSRETLSPQYRRERLKRLVYNSQQPYSCPDPNFIRTTQMGVMQPTWRRKVVEWLLEFVDEFGLPNDIVAVAITYLDVYLSRKQVDKVHLQLLAMVCVFVASKFHEVEPISIQELQTLAEGGYTENSIRDLELELLNTLNWNMNPTTTHHLMRHVANYISPDIRWNLLEHAEGFCDYALTDYELISCQRINVAVASILCALQNIGQVQQQEAWLVEELQRHCNVGTTREDQQEIAAVRHKLQAIFYKNFPHLAPPKSDSDQRALSPTGVDAFPSSRSSSPVHFSQDGHNAVSCVASFNAGPTKVAMTSHSTSHPTTTTSFCAIGSGGGGFASSSSSAFA